MDFHILSIWYVNKNMRKLLKKMAVCLVAGLTVAALLLVVGNSGTIAWFPPPLVFSLCGLALLAGIIYPFIWQWRENSGNAVDGTYNFLFTCIRYCVAFDVATFGWKKIFGLQFVVPTSVATLPMDKQTGEWLTWYYFGYSTTFGIITACLQLAGAYLLVFRKTVLAGCLILMPIMLQIMLINVFYGLNAGALLQSVIITVAIVLLLLPAYKNIVAFLQSASLLPFMHTKNAWPKSAARLAVVLLSLLFVIYLRMRI